MQPVLNSLKFSFERVYLKLKKQRIKDGKSTEDLDNIFINTQEVFKQKLEVFNLSEIIK